jgi:hypothetical protein
MNKFQRLALSGIAALAIGCSSYKDLKRDNTNKLFIINSSVNEHSDFKFDDNSRYDFNDFIDGRHMFFKSFDGIVNLLIVSDTSLRIAYQYFDTQGNDLKIDSISVLVGGYHPQMAKRTNTIMIENFPDNVIWEAYTMKTRPDIIDQLQPEFDKYIHSIEKVKSTLAYQIMHFEGKKKRK